MTEVIKYQRSILATLLAEPSMFDRFAEMCDLIKWSEPYGGMYRAMKSGTRSIVLMLDHPEINIPGDPEAFLIGLMEVHKESELFLSQVVSACIDSTNADYARGRLIDLMNGKHNLNTLTSHLNGLSGEIASLYRVTTFDMAKLNEIQNKRIETNINSGTTSMHCGSPSLQANLMGWHPGHLTAIGGNTSSGKTAFILTILRWAAEANKNIPVAVISYELQPHELHARLLGSVSEVQPRDILFTQLSTEQVSRVHKGMGVLEKLPILIEKPNDSDIETLISKLRVLAANGVKLVAIDFLQLIGDQKIRDKYTRVGSNARRLKNIAMELDIAIVVLSQLNRDNMKAENKRPTMASFRDSGEIEEAIDEAILLYRPEYFVQPGEEVDPEIKGKMEVIYAKGRSTGTGMSILEYEKEYTRVKDPAGGNSFHQPIEKLKPLNPNTNGFEQEGKNNLPVRNYYEVDREHYTEPDF